MISADDWILFVSALTNEWFDRWGKYLKNYFSLEERNQWQAEIYELIRGGIVDREMMVSHFSDTIIMKDLIKVALSSWGGILKDLAYQGKIIYAGADKTYFQICDFSHPIQEEAAKIKLIERYLIGYGPATINDIAHWTQFRVTEVKKLFKRISLSLNTIVEQHKSEYYYLPNSREMNARSIPKYLFLAGFDPLLLGYKDKRKFLKPKERGCRGIKMTGGEAPTLYTKFDEVLKYLAEQNFRMALIFNASLFLKYIDLLSHCLIFVINAIWITKKIIPYVGLHI